MASAKITKGSIFEDVTNGDTFDVLGGTATLTVGAKLATTLTMNEGELPPRPMGLKRKHRSK